MSAAFAVVQTLGPNQSDSYRRSSFWFLWCNALKLESLNVTLCKWTIHFKTKPNLWNEITKFRKKTEINSPSDTLKTPFYDVVAVILIQTKTKRLCTYVKCSHHPKMNAFLWNSLLFCISTQHCFGCAMQTQSNRTDVAAALLTSQWFSLRLFEWLSKYFVRLVYKTIFALQNKVSVEYSIRDFLIFG